VNYPSYLREAGTAPHYYGTLSFNRKGKCWVIKGEPCVTELAKRLFPGCEGRGRGEARFTAHRRIIGELNWLMLRYPLEVRETDREKWEDALAEAREYAAWREARLAMPESATPPEDRFAGELMPFQKQGLAFLLGSRRALLADEMGLGKTVQALSYLATTSQFPALIVVPPHLVRNWQRETERFVTLEDGVRVHVLRGLTPYELPEADVYIVHYLLLRGWKKALPECGFRTVVYDEIQELRHAGTEKYSSASLVASAADSVIGLSGTPIYNHGGEIWNVVNILDFHFLGSWESFSREWCYGYNNNVVAKPDLLGEHLRREGLMLRRTKAEVLPELPPKRRLVQEIDWDDKVYRELMRPVMEKVRALPSLTDASVRALAEDDICQKQRQATGIAKAPYVAAFVKALVDEGESVLLFAHHHAVMDIYKSELKGCHPVFITGRETEGEKDAAAARFMDGKADLCCVSLRSASGLNLQRATCVVFGELDWSPAVHAQAEDRAHRIGHQDSLLCYYLVSPRGSDQDMQESLGLKVSQFVHLMGDETPSQAQVVLLETEARARIQRLVERLKLETED
jgi:SNF2 family DNA or RNA helicase